uniref:Binding-protein-dependent transport systems inner membrane component n=1 Tax=Nitratidesulfovibrio vulgaris (strain DSM 19637 / Miyazaki F) TaxID=883 RepID=B8DQ38_NITV9
MTQRRPFRTASIAVVWLWLGLFALLPNLGLLLVTFLERGESDFVSLVFTWDNYARLADPVFIRILGESLWLAAASTLVCLLIGYPFAYAVATARRGLRPWLLLLVVIPFWTNSLIRTYALIIILKSQGIASNVLMALGLVSEPVSFMYGEFAVFTGLTYTLLPFMILPLYASIEKLDKRLLDAAKDLGASSLRAFWHVTLPLTLPGIVAGCMLVFLPSLGCFYIPEILGGAKSMLIGNFIKNQFLVARDWPLGAAASTILTVLLVLMIIGYWLSSRRVALRERKGADTGAATAGRTPDAAQTDGDDGMTPGAHGAQGARGRA